MLRISSLIIFCLIVALSACKKAENQQNSVVAAEKSPAPEIAVQSLADSSTAKLADFKGKVVMLNFWATWCPPCREEIPSMMKLNAAMAGKPFKMIAVSIDEGGKPAIESFFKESGFSLPTYTDASGAAAKAYGITGVPETFIIDKQGVLVKKVVGGAPWNSPEVMAFLEGLMK